jgi:diguanylate cyclase (GGDEF)-like protein
MRPQKTAISLVAIPIVLALAAMLLSRSGVLSTLACWDVAWTASSFSALVGMLFARRAAAPANRQRWTLWAAASASWFVGQIAWDVFGLTSTPASPNLADVGWWAFAVLVIAGLVRSRAAPRSVRVVGTIETLQVVGAAVALCFAALWHDASISTLALAPKLAALVYPALYVSAAVLMLQAIVGGSLSRSRSRALPITVGGMVIQAVAFTLWTVQLLAGTYTPGATLLDPLWIVGLIVIAVGSLVAAHAPEREAELEEPSKRGGVLPAGMFILLLGFLVRAVLIHAPEGAEVTLAAGLLLSGSALILRGSLLERRLRELLSRERATLASLADREEKLARLNEQLVEDSRRDPLTGMRNRRALSDDLPELDSIHRERGEGMALALCDIDHFKAYNDRLGHLAGDQALRAIAATVRGALRPGDVAYRFGGEELLLVMRDTGTSDTLAAVERVREAVEEVAIPHPDGVGGVLTVSIGLAVGPEDSAVLLARSDAALYEAKHAGRNRAVAARSSSSIPTAARARTVSEEPVPRHLRSMLALSRAAAAGHGVSPVIEALTETIRSELSFQVVAVRLLEQETAQLRCVAVLGDDEARNALLGTVNPWHEWEALLQSEHERDGAIWLPAGSHDWDGETVVWTPPTAAAPGPDGWHPDDMLLLPLRDGTGEILGIVSVDQPLGGLRPDDAELACLMMVCDHAALALGQAERDTVHAAASGQQSSELLLAAAMLLAETLDLRDEGTARHSRTVGAYARETAQAMGLEPDRVERIHAAGVLHDLGKLGIADAILYKPGPLEESEWREIRRHPEIGARILEHAGLREIAAWVRGHHERVDGQGYPFGLPAGEIALEARILAVADAYEAMIADRPYRQGMPATDARDELLRCARTQFDPAVVEAFLGTLDEHDELAVVHAGSQPAELVSGR